MADDVIASADDLSAEYMDGRSKRADDAEAAEFTSWLRRGGQGLKAESSEQGLKVTRPSPFGVKAPPPEPSSAGTIMRSVAEIPRQAFGGVEDAVRNATTIFNPLTDWLNENVADLRIDPVSAPKTGTGRFTRSVAQFLTGFIPALKGLRAVGVTGAVGSVAASAIADFATRDPHEKRLSNLWQEAGLPQNVLTDYLAADPSDSATEGRFKSALESVVTGATLEGMVHAGRALRAARQVAKAQAAAAGKATAMAALKAQYGEVTEAMATKAFGDSARPLVEAVSKKAEKAVQATKGMRPDDLIGGRGVIDAGDMSLYVNFRRIAEPGDVKAVIAEMAEKFKGSIKEAQRGTITHRETLALADDLGLDVGTLLTRQKGQALNAEQLVAARKLWGASAENLLEAARKAAAPNAGELDQFAFRRMLAVHHAVQAEVLGARAEAARALGSWRIPAGGGVEQAKAIKDVIEASGGSGMTQDLAARIAILAEHGGPGAVAKFVEKSWAATTTDAVREVWVNGLLSNPTTHAVNTMSNLATVSQQILERNVAARIGELKGAADGVQPGEATAMAYGTVTSIKDAFRLAAKALRTGESGMALGKIDLPRQKALSAEAFRLGSQTGMGRFVDFLGEAARIPGRFLGAEDEFFKTIGYRAELHAQALRTAVGEGLKGDALKARVASLVANPPENIRMAAVDTALYATFSQTPGAVGQAFLKMREKVPAVTFVLPFIKTPVNIARYTFERTPFAPLVGQWRADLAAGGARADLAMARMATGTAIVLTAMDYADSGIVSGKGPTDPGEREAMMRQGWQPYSLKVGERWYSYNRADPFGSLMGFAADVSERVNRGEIQEDDVDEWGEVMAMGIAAVSQTAINKTYLRGVAEIVTAIEEAGKGRESGSERYVSNLLASFTPYTALVGNVERVVDPTVRESANPWETIQARVAGLSDKLPPKRNLWGEEIRAESGLGKAYDFFSPVQSREIKPSPVDSEIMRLAPGAAGDNVDGAAPQRIGKRANFDGVQVNFKDWPKVYDEYVRLAGNDLKHPAWKLGAKDYLDAVIEGKHPISAVYKTMSDVMKLLFIKTTIAQYRTLAQQQIMSDPKFRDFADYVSHVKADKMQQRMPVVQ